LGVREVWMWDQGQIVVFALRSEGYERLTLSEILPQVDIGLVQSLLDAPTQTAAVRELRVHLRKTRSK
jgi:hypothetical protein